MFFCINCAHTKSILLLFTATCLLICADKTFAQKPELKFTYLNREQGLSHSTVNTIYQDSKGYMWFGTVDGLNRYDGYRITVYRNRPDDPNSLSNNSVAQILEDKSHLIWIVTNYGLNVYDRNQDRFTRYMKDSDVPYSISSNNIRCIYEDSKGGGIWIGTSTGLDYFNADNKTFKHFTHPYKPDENSPDIVVTCLYEDKQGNLWLGTDGFGIEKLNPRTGVFSSLSNSIGAMGILRSMRISVIKEDLKGNIWIGTTGNGVFLYNRSINTLQNYLNKQNDQSSLSNNVIKSILCDHKGNIWIGTETGGMNLWAPDKLAFIRYENNPQKPSTLSQKTVSALFEDKQGNLWVGTHRGGVNVYSSNAYKFKTYTQGTSPGTLSFNDVKTFFEDRHGTIWIGTDGGGINLWDKKNDTFTQYRHNPNQPSSIGSDVILHIMQDHTGTIWVGTWGGGLNRFNKSTKTFTRFLHSPQDRNSITSNNVWRIHEDGQGNIWIATFNGGLNLFNSKTQKFKKITSAPDGRTHFKGNNVITINEDKAGNLWFGTDDGGLNCLTANRQKFINYFDKTQKDLVNGVRTIFIDSKNRLWIGKNGLSLFNEKQKNFLQYSSNPYLANEKIQAITEDSKGNLWISTNNGLIKFNPQTRYLKRFTDADGLQGLEFWPNACLKTNAGQMLFGGTQGFSIFHPDSIKTNNYTYPLYITDLQVFNKSIQHGKDNSPIENYISEASKITLNHNQSVFSFEYAALNYVAPTKTQYAYLLKGFDKNWNYVGSQRKATYTNLDPGDYTFSVKASTPEGLWNTPATSIKVTIKPPFWMALWFKLLIGIMVIGTAFLFLYYRRKADLKVLYEQKREEIHQLQLQFFTNISHEFRTPLMLILGPLEQILKQDTRSVFTHHYNTMYRNGNRLMQLISELMDFRKAESGALKLKVMPGNFSLFLNEIAHEFNELALQHHIEFTVKQEKEYTEVWFDRQVVEKILLNLINNSFKYTPQNGSISIEVLSSLRNYQSLYEHSLKLENEYRGREYIYVSVADNGIGISKNSINHLFERYYRITDKHLGSGVGLAFVKSLTFLHKGSIYVYSERHKGTNIIIAIPFHKEDYTNEEKWLSDRQQEGGVQLESIQYNEALYTPNYSSGVLQNVKAVVTAPCILIVDDNEELRAYIKEVLEPHYHIIEAANGEEGIIKAKNESPALILSDVMMPVMNGIDFCIHIKSDIATSHIPFILLTAKDALESRLQGVESGADYYFSKPVSTDLLLITIKNLFDHRQKIKERYFKDYQVEVRELVHSAKDKEFMDQLLKILEQNLDDPELLNVDYVCRKIGISKTKLYKKIKDITGQTINEFIRTIRLKKAMEIMTHEDVQITDVMYRVGILSQSYFTTVFKKEFGIAPSHFHRQIKRS